MYPLVVFNSRLRSAVRVSKSLKINIITCLKPPLRGTIEMANFFPFYPSAGCYNMLLLLSKILCERSESEGPSLPSVRRSPGDREKSTESVAIFALNFYTG